MALSLNLRQQVNLFRGIFIILILGLPLQYLIATSILLHSKEYSLFLDKYVSSPVQMVLLLGGIGAVLTGVFIWRFAQAARRQAFESQYSWTLLLLVFATTQFTLLFLLDTSKKETVEWYVGFGICGALLLVYLASRLGMLIRYRTFKAKEKYLKGLWVTRFASGSIGRKDDVFDFKDSADHFARYLALNTQYVSVVGLYGTMGSGKSSFWRMAMESGVIKSPETLYTYISLTETNKTSDFSKLFAERWLATLKERYVLDFTATERQLINLYDVLREGNNSILRMFIKFSEHFNFPLFKTQTGPDGYDPNAVDGARHMFGQQPEVRKIFNYLPYVKEKRWVICIDEIERSPVAEIYRVIEVIERFKQLGRTGMPVKLLLVVCFDKAELQNRLAHKEVVGDKGALVDAFFLQSPKSFDMLRRVPPVTRQQKLDFICNNLERLREEEKLPKGAFHDIDSVSSFQHGLRLYQKEIRQYTAKAALDTAILLLANEELRTIGRVFDRLEGLYSEYSTDDDNYDIIDRTAIGDVLAFVVAELRYPEALELVYKGYLKYYSVDFDDSADSWLYKHRLEEEKSNGGTPRDFWKKVEDEIGILVEEPRRQETMRLANIIFYPIVNFISTGDDIAKTNAMTLYGRAGSPEALEILLGSHPQYRYERSVLAKVYQGFREGERWATELNDPRVLTAFTKFVRFSSGDDTRQATESLDLAEYVIDFMSSRSFKEPVVSIRDDPTYSLAIQFGGLIAEGADWQARVKDKRRATSLFRRFIQEPGLPYESKIGLLNMYVGRRNGGNHEYVVIREEVFEQSGKNPQFTLRLFDEMYGRFFDEYLPGTKSIYTNELNPSYVTHQLWNGTNEDSRLNDLRTIRRYGLTNLKALEFHWDQLPYKSNYENYKNVLKDDDTVFSLSSVTHLVTLKTLLDASSKSKRFTKLRRDNPELNAKVRFWRKLSKSKEVREAMQQDHPDADTLAHRINQLRLR